MTTVNIAQKSVILSLINFWCRYSFCFWLTHKQGFFSLRQPCRFYLAGLCQIPTIINKLKNIMDSSHIISLNTDLFSFLYIRNNFICYQIFATYQLYKYDKGKKKCVLTLVSTYIPYTIYSIYGILWEGYY